MYFRIDLYSQTKQIEHVTIKKSQEHETHYKLSAFLHDFLKKHNNKYDIVRTRNYKNCQ